MLADVGDDEGAGDRAGAAKLLERSFQLNPADAQVAITLAELYNRANRPDDARPAKLLDLGAAVTDEELDAVRDWKIDVLNRIALDPGVFVDEREGDELREMCRREATALRLGLPSTWGDRSCP